MRANERFELPLHILSHLYVRPTHTIYRAHFLLPRIVVASNLDINQLAKKAFVSYLKSLLLQPNKEVFDVENYDTAAYAASLGLPGAPNVRFLRNGDSKAATDGLREENRRKKNKNRELEKVRREIKEEKLKKRLEKLRKKGRIEDSKKSEGRRESSSSDEEGDNDDGLLVVKKKHEWGEEDVALLDSQANGNNNTKPSASKKQKIRQDGTSGYTKVKKFDDSGEVVDDSVQFEDGGGIVTSREELVESNAAHVERVRKRLLVNKDKDKLDERERLIEKRKKRKMEARGEDESGREEFGVQLGGISASNDDYDDDDDENDSSDSSDSSDSGSESGSDSDSDSDSGDFAETEKAALAKLQSGY